jgi:ATP-dependent DNA helicase RecQ
MEELLFELKNVYGKKAEFREGQQEAIQGVLDGQRLLVVQKTGWGKSLVYFLATKVLRKRYNGITLIISPLLALMNNQIESANKLGLHVETINSENAEDWDFITEKLNQGKIDALIISPERLANPEFKRLLIDRLAAQITLFVVDEAHCISDWGHDFRPDYRRIVDIINILPSNIPVLATTATANNRVVNDIKKQLGDKLLISRGSLMRESLSLQVIELYSKEARMAWILQYIDTLPGTGIIYCLTVNDCKLLNKWLNKNGIYSESYFAGLETEKKSEVVNSFMNNSIKVLVATVAFGMGFDKPDIGFVIHFQRPGNIVAYYQQIGRAGRGIDQAYAILLCGGEDEDINNYFIDSAFPTEELMEAVVNTVMEHPGIRITQFEKYINMKATKIKACVKYLLVNGDIYVEDKKYYKTTRIWKPDLEKSREITNIRKKELLEMKEFSKQGNCYMEYIANVLDDPHAKACGICENCVGQPLLKIEVPEDLVLHAQQFIREDFNLIEARKKWPSGERIDGKNLISTELMCEIGRVLSNYGDAGWGKLVSSGKYKDGFFDNQLVEASALLLKNFIKDNNIKWVTSVPSIRRPELVKSFAERLALRLGLRYYDVIDKVKDNRCQKELNTSYLQYKNAYGSFEVRRTYNENVLLVDDMVDSRWTFTVCGYKLRKSGSGKVFPFALANSAGRNGDE